MKILLAVDGSDCSEDTVAAVVSRPWPKGTLVRVLSVVPPILVLTPEMAIYSSESLDKEQQDATESAKQFTSRVSDWLRSSGLPSETTVRSGEPRSVILEEAQGWDADLVVVGSHGHKGFKRWLLGSVAQSVVSNAGCSVEVVRQKASNQLIEELGSTKANVSHAAAS
jgi:nucleotide-binding universal stress UspA family protein